MTAPGDSVLIFLLLALLVACSGYAAGRLHQRWQTALDREEAYRDGYETGTRSVFSTAVRMLGPRRPVRASAPVQKAGPGLAAEPTVPVAAGPALSFPLPEPPPPYAVPEPPALGGVTYHKFPDPRLTAEEGLTDPQPRLVDVDAPVGPRPRFAGADIPAAPSPRSRVSGAETPAGSGPRPAGTPAGPHPHPAGAGTPAAPDPRLAAAEAPTDSRPRLADRSGLALGAPAKAAAPDAAPDAVAEAARQPGPAPRRRPNHRADTEAGRTPAAPSAASTSGRHTVPDELVQATTYRLPPDRVFRAKVKESSRLPEEPTTKLSVPKPRKS